MENKDFSNIIWDIDLSLGDNIDEYYIPREIYILYIFFLLEEEEITKDEAKKLMLEGFFELCSPLDVASDICVMRGHKEDSYDHIHCRDLVEEFLAVEFYCERHGEHIRYHYYFNQGE